MVTRPEPGRDFDPAGVPVVPAATVMLVADRPDLQVLMLRRNRRSIFVPNMWVFPGGAVDPEDADLAPHCRGIDDAAASAELGVEAGGLAWWVAAVRECFEETGVVLADHDVPGGRLEEHRDVLNANEREFGTIVRSEAMVLDAETVHYVGRWITPLGSPRRYDARFFAAAMPADQVPRHDDDEAVHHEWLRPADALGRYDSGDMEMMTPTVCMLRWLARFDRAADVVAAAASGRPLARARVAVTGEGLHTPLLPDDDGYETAVEDVEMGWVRV